MTVKRPKIETRDIVTPDTGITVTIKSKQTYGDSKAIQSAVFGNVEVEVDKDTAPEDVAENLKKPRISLVQAEQMRAVTMVRMMVAWNVEEEDGSPTPLTAENIDDIFTPADVTFVMQEIQPSDEDKKKLVSDS